LGIIIGRISAMKNVDMSLPSTEHRLGTIK
jgi:hypothetical protein